MVCSGAVTDLRQTAHTSVTQLFSLSKSTAQPCPSRTNNLLVPPKVWQQGKEVQPTLRFYPAAKRPGQPLAATDASGHNICRLLHVTDRISKRNFLVDTGAQVSIIPPTRSDRLRKRESFTLSAVNGSTIATYGQRSLTLNLGLRRTFRWIFIIADVSKPLLGADFLHHFGLLVDMAHGKLVDTHTHLSIHTEGTPPSPTTTTPSHAQVYSSLLSEFPDLPRIHNYQDTPVKQHYPSHQYNWPTTLQSLTSLP